MSIKQGDSVIADAVYQRSFDSTHHTIIRTESENISSRDLWDRVMRWSAYFEENEAEGVLVGSRYPIIRLELQLTALSMDLSFCSVPPGYSYFDVEEVCANSGVNLMFLDSKNYLRERSMGEMLQSHSSLYVSKLHFDGLVESSPKLSYGAILVDDWSDSQTDYFTVDNKIIELQAAFLASHYIRSGRELVLNTNNAASFAALLKAQFASLVGDQPIHFDSSQMPAEAKITSAGRKTDKAWVIPEFDLPFAISRQGRQILRPLPGYQLFASSCGHLYLQLNMETQDFRHRKLDTRLLDTQLMGYVDDRGCGVIEEGL